ncbi:MAG: serine hydrolase [Pseudomonadota bacterium]
MNQTLTLTALLLRSLTVVVLSTAGAAANEPAKAHRLTPLIKRGMTDWQVPGLGFALFENGRAVYAQGFGHTRLEDGAAVDTSTFFINASTTKAMVAAGVLMLVDDGQLDLDDRLIEHLPDVHFADPALTAQVSIRDLLTHRTGLPSTDFWTFNQGLSIEDQVHLLRHVEPIAGLRERKIYQNTMYELAGLVIQRLSGKPWHEFLDERLWNPIGMRTVATRDAIPQGAIQASPYGVFDEALREMNHSLQDQVSDAAGSAWSSINDMVLWVEFLLRGGVTADGQRLLSEAALEEMFTPQQLVDRDDYYPSVELTRPNWISYGLGWYQQDFQGRKIDYHTGSLNGATAIIGLDRQQGRAMVMLANRGGAELRHALLWAAMDLEKGPDRTAWHDEILALYEARSQRRAEKRATIAAGRLDVPPSLSLSAYAGHYDSETGGPLQLVVDERGLRLDTGARTYRLTPWHSETFELTHQDWATSRFARFSLTPAGTIDGLEAFGHRFERTADTACVDPTAHSTSATHRGCDANPRRPARHGK